MAAIHTQHSHPKRLFVLDTNVLMHDPTALFRFQEHDIFLPMVVLEEMEPGHHQQEMRKQLEAHWQLLQQQDQHD